ncbi:MAG: FAD-dependent oxidoreductase [Pyrinomonadaceae bacterium]|nr:FAD-dependent oxidoreductase [Pyrinomonadaceae bacterium]
MRIGILGAGVAGLSCAYFLRREFPDLQVHEASGHVGGLARSFRWHGFDCDLAPHRLFTSDEALLKELLALLPMNRVTRRSRIFLQGVWIRDPVNAAEMVLKLHPALSLKIVWHYLFRRRYHRLPVDNFESLILNKFGSGLNELFFKPYSEKLFGIPASEISADWGRRKIRVAGLRDMWRRDTKLYFQDFYYPRRGGYGAICERLHEDVRPLVRLDSKLIAVSQSDGGGVYRCEFATVEGTRIEEFDVLISTLPLPFFAGLLGLDLRLRFRPAKITYLLLNRPRATDNQWFYFADREFIINRVAEFKNFAGDEAPADHTVLCCEVTATEDYSPARVIAELEQAEVLDRREVLDTKIIDLPYAYPIYDHSYDEQTRRARDFFAQHPRIHHVGRQAQFAHRDVDEIFEEAKLVAGRIAGRQPPSTPDNA